MITLTFKIKKTKNTIRYEAISATENSVKVHPPITTIYVGKHAFSGNPAPQELTITLTL